MSGVSLVGGQKLPPASDSELTKGLIPVGTLSTEYPGPLDE